MEFLCDDPHPDPILPNEIKQPLKPPLFSQTLMLYWVHLDQPPLGVNILLLQREGGHSLTGHSMSRSMTESRLEAHYE